MVIFVHLHNTASQRARSQFINEVTSNHAIEDTGLFLTDNKGYSICQLPIVTSRRHYDARVSGRVIGRCRTLQNIRRQTVATDTCYLK
jgi:hypothetical protein